MNLRDVTWYRPKLSVNFFNQVYIPPMTTMNLSVKNTQNGIEMQITIKEKKLPIP